MSAGSGWSQGISIALTLIVTSWVTRMMVQAGRQQAARAADGAFELRYPRWYAWLGVGVLMVGALMAIVGGVATVGGPVGTFLLVIGVGGTMAAGGGWMTLEMLRRVIRVHPDRLEMRDLRDQVHELRWDGVTQVRFRKVAGYLVIEGNGLVIQASMALAGLQTIIDRLKVSVPPSLWTQALADLEAYRTRQAGNRGG